MRSRPAFEQTLKRQGRRAAYVQSAFYYELRLTTPRHGDRPFEIGHIDHTQLDVEVVCSQTGRPLGRPWMSILTDAYSRRCLALYLTFDEPSYRSCMMILRDCVSRHNRLLQIIVVDGSPHREFLWTSQMSRDIFFAMAKGETLSADKSEVLQGTLDMMILKTLHGWVRCMDLGLHAASSR